MRPIAVLGSLNIDLVFRCGRFPAPGENVFTRSFDVVVGGGKGGNQAMALARLGATVRMVGLTGTQMQGPDYPPVLAAAGVDIAGIGTAPGMPGLGIVGVDDHGENLIFVHSGANGLVDEAYVAAQWGRIDGCAVLLLQNEIPVAANRAAMRRARDAGITVVLDPAPADGFDRSLLALADIVTPNRSELAAIAGMAVTDGPSTIAAAQRLLELGARTVVAKAGADGAWIVDAGQAQHIPPFRVHAIDPTAAGDTCNAGIAYGLASGWGLARSVRFANAAAAITCTALGAQTAMPTLAQVEALLAR